MYRVKKMANEHPDFYENLNRELLHLIDFEDEWLAALSNAAALLGHQLDYINWAGFYLMKNGVLILGPFQGKPACSAIAPGFGVCGSSVTRKETIVVPDVHEFPGHIACDEASQSEIVVPIMYKGEVKGVLDIDSPIRNRFLPRDQAGLEEFVNTLARAVKWDKMNF